MRYLCLSRYGQAPGAGALRLVVALPSFFPVLPPKRAQ
jgi:hypothetical protein